MKAMERYQSNVDELLAQVKTKRLVVQNFAHIAGPSFLEDQTAEEINNTLVNIKLRWTKVPSVSAFQ
jgi:hypothetical protein